MESRKIAQGFCFKEKLTHSSLLGKTGKATEGKKERTLIKKWGGPEGGETGLNNEKSVQEEKKTTWSPQKDKT